MLIALALVLAYVVGACTVLWWDNNDHTVKGITRNARQYVTYRRNGYSKADSRLLASSVTPPAPTFQPVGYPARRAYIDPATPGYVTLDMSHDFV